MQCDTININNIIPDPSLYTGNYTAITFSDQDKINAAEIFTSIMTSEYHGTDKFYTLPFKIYNTNYGSYSKEYPMITPYYTVYGIAQSIL